MRAGTGWKEGFVGSKFEVAWFQEDGGGRLADGPLLIDDLPSTDDFSAGIAA